MTAAGGVYVLCIRPAYFHARHCVGWTADPDPARRVAEHLAGQGSALIRAAVAARRAVDLVLSMAGDRHLERKLHNRHGTRVCPRCKAQRPPRPRHLPMFRRQPASPRRGAGARPLWRLHP